MIAVYSEFKTKDIIIRYVKDILSGTIGLQILPLEMKDSLVEHRKDISDQKEAWIFENWGAYPEAARVEPLVQLSCSGDNRTGGFGNGLTMRGSSSTERQKFIAQNVSSDKKYTTVNTELSVNESLKINHSLRFNFTDSFITTRTELINNGDEPVSIEMLSSFTLGGMTSFAAADAEGRLNLHRFRTYWSAEARHTVESLEDLGLESSWSNHGVRCERFGQRGTMPVRGWYPFAAVEDKEAGVFWGVQIEAQASWQIEASRRDDFINLSGGLADREFGHWLKILSPGDSLKSPEAYLTTVKSGFDDLCSRLLEQQLISSENMPGSEKGAPVVFNEWCTSWGQPEAGQISRYLPILKQIGIKYYVIDAGWYDEGCGSWETAHGDWNVSTELFPQGLKKTCDEIRSYGIVPGLWFEFETAGIDSRIINKHEWLLQKDGFLLRSGARYFLDFRNPEVRNYLRQKVIKLLKSQGFGYLKIDYNETTGIGCDGGDSPADGIRENILASQDFINEIRREIPGIVIENCSSGGHRQEPSFINLTDMSSFSDAHETVNIPIIAANLCRLIISRKCQIWAVLHPDDTVRRMYYSLSAAFLGRMCISGEIGELSLVSIEIIREAVKLYKKAVELIDIIKTERFGPEVQSYRHPRGWQAVSRISEIKNKGLLVIHTFEDSPQRLNFELSSEKVWKISGSFKEKNIMADMKKNVLTLRGLRDFTGIAILLNDLGVN